MSFRFEQLDLPGVLFIQPKVVLDGRGWFMETYKYSALRAAGITERFVQDNAVRSKRGVLRGLHYQRPPKAQGKLIQVVVGKVFDVVVDVRRGSPTRGCWMSVVLSAEKRPMLYVPPGYAHGYCVVSEEAEVIYKVTKEYAPAYEAGLLWNDPALHITWPISSPVVSPRDEDWPPFQKAHDRTPRSRE